MLTAATLLIFVMFHLIILALLIAWLTHRAIDHWSLLALILYLISITFLAILRQLVVHTAAADLPRYLFTAISTVVAARLMWMQLPGVGELWGWLRHRTWRQT